MSASLDELKTRLAKFLSDPKTDEQEFRAWFAHLLMTVRQQSDQELEDLAFAVRTAFADAADGVYTRAELNDLLTDFAQPSEDLETYPVGYSVKSVKLSAERSKKVEVYVRDEWGQLVCQTGC